jgi:hypothetical protein
MSKQAIGNALAGMAFLVIAIVDFTRDSSGLGSVFLVFAAVFVGLVRQEQPVQFGRLTPEARTVS